MSNDGGGDPNSEQEDAGNPMPSREVQARNGTCRRGTADGRAELCNMYLQPRFGPRSTCPTRVQRGTRGASFRVGRSAEIRPALTL